MPMQTGKSSLLAKLGPNVKSVHEQHKSDKTEHDSGGSVPAGIDNGIAQLVECKFGEYKEGPNKGKPFFMAIGVCVEPKAVDGIPTEGLRTQIGPEALCDTPQAAGKRKTFAQHYAWMLNQMRLLGVDTTEIQPEQLESTAAAIKESSPFIRFRTWKAKKQTTGPFKDVEPRVNHVWDGVVNYEGNGQAPEAGTEDQTESATAGGETAQEEGIDLESLVEKASNKDVAAQKQLTQLAKEAGASDEIIESAENWGEVAALIAGGSETGEGQQEEQEEPPAKGSVYQYQLLDKSGKPVVDKSGKPKKPVKVEIVSSDAESRSSTVKNLDTKALIKGVSWDSLKAV